MIPDDLRYTDQHEWIRVAGDVGVVGISDHAQDALGDVTFVELPVEGTELTKGQEACAIESAKAAVSIYAPVSGKVVGVNAELEDDPGLVNTSPYGEGWIYKIAPADPSEIDALMDAAAYGAFLSSQEE
jgi:glycine cleavage system H protein